MQPFDLLLVKGESIVSNTIKKLTDSEYSHVAVVLNEHCIYETKINKPFQAYVNDYEPHEYDIYRMKDKLTPFQKYTMQRYLMENQNVKYDLMKTVSNGLFILFKFPIIDVANRLNCVESAKGVYFAGGINLNGITPQEISENECLIKVTEK